MKEIKKEGMKEKIKKKDVEEKKRKRMRKKKKKEDIEEKKKEDMEEKRKKEDVKEKERKTYYFLMGRRGIMNKFFSTNIGIE